VASAPLTSLGDYQTRFPYLEELHGAVSASTAFPFFLITTVTFGGSLRFCVSYSDRTTTEESVRRFMHDVVENTLLPALEL